MGRGISKLGGSAKATNGKGISADSLKDAFKGRYYQGTSAWKSETAPKVQTILSDAAIGSEIELLNEIVERGRRYVTARKIDDDTIKFSYRYNDDKPYFTKDLSISTNIITKSAGYEIMLYYKNFQ